MSYARLINLKMVKFAKSLQIFMNLLYRSLLNRLITFSQKCCSSLLKNPWFKLKKWSKAINNEIA